MTENWDHYSDLPAPAAYAQSSERTYITLSRDEWSKIHNSLCRAESMYANVFDILKNGTEMREALDHIRSALAPAYKQDNDNFDRQHEYYNKIKNLHGFASTWSIYSVDDFDAPHPFVSHVFVKYTDHWGDNKHRHYPVAGTTWLDVWHAADLALHDSGDNHHVFIEGFSQDKSDHNLIHLQTGS